MAGNKTKREAAGDLGFAAILRAAGKTAPIAEAPLGRRERGEAAAVVPAREGSEPTSVLGRSDREHHERCGPDAREDLAGWAAPPPALLPPVVQHAAPPPAAGSAAAHAEAAAMAEKLVTQLRVGRTGRDGHEVRMKLAIRGTSGLDVRLAVHDGGRLSAELVADAGMHGEARRIADALRDELAARGFTLDLDLS